MVIVSNEKHLKDGDTAKLSSQQIPTPDDDNTATTTTTPATTTTTATINTNNANTKNIIIISTSTIANTNTNTTTTSTAIPANNSATTKQTSKINNTRNTTIGTTNNTESLISSSLTAANNSSDEDEERVSLTTPKSSENSHSTSIVLLNAGRKNIKRNINAIKKGANDHQAEEVATDNTTSPSTNTNNTKQDQQHTFMMMDDDSKVKSDDFCENSSSREKHESETNSEALSTGGHDISSETVTLFDMGMDNNNLEYEAILAEVNGENTLQSMGSPYRSQPPPVYMRENTLTTFAKPPTSAAFNAAINSVLNTTGGNSSAQSVQMGIMTTASPTTMSPSGTFGGGGAGVISINNGALTQQQQQQHQQTAVYNNKAYGGGAINAKAFMSSMGGPRMDLSSAVGGDVVMEANNTASTSSNGNAKIILIHEPTSHPFETRSISLTPNVECKVGRLIAKSKALEGNAIFDCKVLSRNHAVIWYTPEGKFYVKDTKSSNGTFINDIKLGNEPAELHCNDVVKFGVDVMENSRKEVHGCIIALVKLYLPDGRESISIDSQSQRQQFTGANRITFDEIQRLNAFMQEAAQREKMLKQKLCSLQSVLDSTRKNSALCWQSMISEDQLLHKITLLEKKLQIMEKNIPDNTLRNEIMKLLDDKNSYQLTAKDALRKVYQERCEALQLISKMETEYATSENECTILRDQITSTKEALEEVNERLMQVETEYNEYKDETSRTQQEAKEQEEKNLAELKEQLANSLEQCEMLRVKVAELEAQLKLHAQNDKYQEQQALAKLDACIPDMDSCDEDDDDEDEDDDNVDLGDNELTDSAKEHADVERTRNAHNSKSPRKFAMKKKSKKERTSNMLKLLQNSDLNKGDDNVLKAILNDGDELDQQRLLSSSECSPTDDNHRIDVCFRDKPVVDHYNLDFSSLLEDVEKNLQKVENESMLATAKAERMISSLNDGSAAIESDTDEEDDDDDDQVKNGVTVKKSSPLTSSEHEDSQSYQSLKKSVNKLRNAFNKLCCEGHHLTSGPQSPTVPTIPQNEETQMQQQHQQPKLQTQDTLVSSEHITPNTSIGPLLSVKSDDLLAEQKLEMLQVECDSWKGKVSDLNAMVNDLRKQKEDLEHALSATSSDQNKIEKEPTNNEESRICAGTVGTSDEDNLSAVTALNSNSEQQSQEIVASNLKNDNMDKDKDDFEEQMRTELVSLNCNELEQEEELIFYKERLEQSESCNVQLRNEISQLRMKQHGIAHILRQALPAGALAVVAFVYYYTISSWRQ